jgi:DNA-binding NtrC family response regulator
MNPSEILKGKSVLVVDDEEDVLEAVEEILDMCLVQTARDYDSARQYLISCTYDFVILDIMGVNGFDLLKLCVERGFPAVMLTAYAMTPEALEKSMRLGAVAFLPKEKMVELKDFLVEVVLGAGQPIWKSLFRKLSAYFDQRFGPDWREKKKMFEDFEALVRRK